jgi:PTH1 family peptidyl-tRNA hydrolase
MILLAGLGNPGPKYARNRHNAGFMVADEIVRHYGLSPWRAKFQGEVSDGVIDGEKVLVLKPGTFMNESGRAVGEAMRFYNLEPEDVVVIHDELDLPPGKFRMKTGGGHAGNNGLRSIIQHIGAEFHRVRFGIGHPGHKDKVHGYVLKDFSKEDLKAAEPLIDALVRHLPLLVTRQFATYQNKVHLDLAPDDRPARKDKAKKEPAADGKQSPDNGGAGGTGPFAALRNLIGGAKEGD